MAAQHGFNPAWAVGVYREKRDITTEQAEIFLDGYEGVNRDYAENLDRAYG